MNPYWTDARVLTRVGIIETLAAQLYHQSGYPGRWDELDASDRVEWRKRAVKVYDEALMNYG